MNKQLTTFPFSGNNVRVLGTKIEPWFVAVDVLRALGVHEKNMTRVINSLDDDEKMVVNLTTKTDSSVVNLTTDEEYPTNLTTDDSSPITLMGETKIIKGSHNTVWIISEPGFYKIAFRSQNPVAKKFTRFVAHEVLPSIRRYGYYKLPHVKMPQTHTLSATGEKIDNIGLRDMALDFGMTVTEFERTSKERIISYVERKLSEKKDAENFEQYKNGDFPYTYTEVDKMCNGCLEDVRYALHELYPQETFSVNVGGFLSDYEELFNEFFVSHIPEGMEHVFGKEAI